MEEKKEVEEKMEEKGKQSFLSNINPLVLLIIGVVIFLIFINLSNTKDFSYIWWILGIIVILYFISQSAKPQLKPITPREADLLVEQEVKRKIYWRQGTWDPMTKYNIGPVSDHAHSDARGKYYDVAVEMRPPFQPVEYWVAKVMSTGDERGNVYWRKAISPITGRDTQQERSILNIPSWMLNSKKYPEFGDFLKRQI
jgi:hypothetical protein